MEPAENNKDLDTILKRYHIARQLYHNNSLLGNHCDLFLENHQNIINEISERFGANIFYQNMMEVSNILNCIFPILAQPSTTATDEQCEILQTLCTRFGEAWRKLYDNSKLTPKFHLLEKHVPQQYRKFGFFADFSEEKVEKMHQVIKQGNITYKNIPNWEKGNRLVLNRMHFSLCSDCRKQMGYVFVKTGQKEKEKTKKKKEEKEQVRKSSLGMALQPIVETLSSFLN